MSFEGRSVLWVDDQIAAYKAHIQRMEDEGIEVVAATCTAIALDTVKSRQFDAAIVDLLVPSEGGVVLLESLRENQTRCETTVLSSYSDIDSFRSGIEQLGYRVSILEKPLADVRSPRFITEFIPALFRKPSETSGRFRTLESLPPTRSVFEINFRQFQEMTTGASALLTEMAHDQAQETIEQQFNEGAAWVMLCGDKDEPFRCEGSLDRIPSAEEITRLAMIRDRAPFQFIRPLEIDDLDGHWPAACSEQSHARGYPTVTLQFSEKFRMHFDTGSPFTIIDEECVRDGWLSATNLPMHMNTSKGRWTGRLIKQTGLIHCQEGTTTRRVELTGVTHPNWRNSSLARECRVDCAHHKKDNNGCIFRRGLVGRNLIQENDVTIALVKSMRTKVIP